jgi:alpha-ribazole phosphatase
MMPTPRALPRHALLRHVFLRHPPLPQAQGLCYGRLDLPLPCQSFDHTAARLLRARVDGAAYPQAADQHADLEHAPLEHAPPEHVALEHAALEAATPDDIAPALLVALQRLPIISSPAQRCLGLSQALHRLRMGTAEYSAANDGSATNAATQHIAAAGRTAPIVDVRFMEMDFGEWEGRAWSEVPREQLDIWAVDVVGYRPPGGESFADVIARVAAALADLREPHLIVTHGGAIRAAWHLLGGRTLADAAALQVAYATPMPIPISPSSSAA